MTWKAQIAIKCNGGLTKAHWDEVKKWAQVGKIWSSMGEWDYWMSLNTGINDTDELESFVFKLRQQPWVNSTSTRWWKEV